MCPSWTLCGQSSWKIKVFGRHNGVKIWSQLNVVLLGMSGMLRSKVKWGVVLLNLDNRLAEDTQC